jgi:hypothetical protein
MYNEGQSKEWRVSIDNEEKFRDGHTRWPNQPFLFTVVNNKITSEYEGTRFFCEGGDVVANLCERSIVHSTRSTNVQASPRQLMLQLMCTVNQ